MDNSSNGQSNLIPISLLNTSLFQRKRQSLTNPSNSSASSPLIRGTPIAVPQAVVTELFPPEDLLIKDEPVDNQRPSSITLPQYQSTTTIDSDSDEAERILNTMPVNNYNNYSSSSRDPRDRLNYRESSMFPDSRPKETPRFNNRVGMSVPPPDSSYMDSRRDDRNPYPNNPYNDSSSIIIGNKDPRSQRNDDPRPVEPRGRDWNDRDRRGDNRAPDPFLQDQSRGGRSQVDAPPSHQRRYDNSYDRREPSHDRREPSRPPERGRFPEGGSNKRRNESGSPKPRKRTGSMTEDVRSGIAEVSLGRNQSPGPSNAVSPRSPSGSGDSEHDRAHQRSAANSTIGRTKSVISMATIEANGGPDVNMSSPRKSETKSSESKRRSKRRRTAMETSGESSSSESTSSDSDSSSDESDVPRLTGASGLKLHGLIHDLMLELERTRTKHAKYCEKVKASSKKIRDISKKLERRFRDLSESAALSRETTAPAPVPAPERPAIMSRPSSERFIQYNSSSAMSNKASSSLPATPKSVPATLNARSGSSRARLLQYNDRISVASLDVVETLTNVHSDVRNKTFSRKPRSMVHHSAIAGSDMEEVMVTSSLDGQIQFWDLEKRRVTSTIPKGPTNMPWAEDICWVGKNTLAVASAHKEGVIMNNQLMLVHVEKAKPNSSIVWTLQPLDQKPHETSKGGIMCITSLMEDQSGISLATAGMDKQVIRWKFMPPNSDGDCVPSQQTVVHNRHTSTIQSLCYLPHNNVLYSGGSDCRVISWDMGRSEIVTDYRSTERGRINSITPNPVDPNLLLVAHATTSNQLSLHDIRLRFDEPVLRFGFECADNLSRQIMPSWHPGGAIVSCGTQSDPKINIWDVRWRDVHRGAGQSIDGQTKRVFKAAFHPKRPFITSMSADSSLAFVDFRLNPGTIVHR